MYIGGYGIYPWMGAYPNSGYPVRILGISEYRNIGHEPLILISGLKGRGGAVVHDVTA